jgi:hypothetical protein
MDDLLKNMAHDTTIEEVYLILNEQMYVLLLD